MCVLVVRHLELILREKIRLTPFFISVYIRSVLTKENCVYDFIKVRSPALPTNKP